MTELSERLKRKLDGKDLQLNEVNQRLKRKLDEKDEQFQRLKKKLDDKDEQIEHLKRRLDRKDVKIRSLQETLEAEGSQQVIVAEQAGSLAEAALKLNQVFEAAQAAADQYLYNVRRRYGTAEEEPDSPEDRAEE